MKLLINAKKLIYIFLIFSLQSSICNLYSQWVTQNSGTTQHLYDMSFINTQTGWVCGNNGTMLKTTNGGNNWVTLNVGMSDVLNAIYFINENTGWAATRATGKIIKTTNGGNNWNLIFHTGRASFNSIFFLNSNYGWVAGVGIPNQCFKTTNGGNSWDSVAIYPATGNHIQFIDQLNGWICIGSQIYKTSNGGNNWTQLFTTNGNGEIIEFSFVNPNSGWLVTEGSYRVYKTTDGGYNWIFLEALPVCFFAESVFFSNLNTGWISGGCGYLYSTTNTGLNWSRQQTNTNSFLAKVLFVTDSIGWCVGGAGRIIYTNSSGQILGLEQIGNVIPNEFILHQNYPNPFNSETTIEFEISKSDNYQLEIINVLGQRVDIIFNRLINAGKYKISYNSSVINSGVYFYKLSSSENSLTKKFILIK